MEEFRFLVQGSAAEPYEVHFVNRGDKNISAYCSCPAGDMGVSCKHRINIFNGITKGIVSDNASDVETVKSWLAGSDIEAALKEIDNVEEELAEVKKKLTKAKKALGQAMLR